MIRYLLGAAVSVTLLVCPAEAAENYPDLRGTWTGQADAVFIGPSGQSRIGENSDKQPATFGSAEFKLIVEKQKDRRFSGTVTVQNWTKQIVGAVFKNGFIRWAEPGGFVEAELTARDTLQTCYIRASEFSQMVSCAKLERQ